MSTRSVERVDFMHRMPCHQRGFLGALLLLVGTLAGCAGPLTLTNSAEVGFFPRDDLRMHYVLDFPEGGVAPFPAIVLGHGSGPKTIRDVEGFAEGMLDLGFAVLRYDKRGTGESGGRFVPSSSLEVNTAIPDAYAVDMAAAARFIRGHPKIDPARVGLMGESQAGWVIPPAAVEADSVAFVIVLSGPVIPLGDVGAYEGLAYERPDLPPDSVMAVLAREGRLRGRGFDPGPYLERLHAPGLWIYGARDRNVPAPANVRVVEELAREPGHPFTAIMYPNGDHGLRDADTGRGIPWRADVENWLRGIGFPLPGRPGY